MVKLWLQICKFSNNKTAATHIYLMCIVSTQQSSF